MERYPITKKDKELIEIGLQVLADNFDVCQRKFVLAQFTVIDNHISHLFSHKIISYKTDLINKFSENISLSERFSHLWLILAFAK